MIALLDYRAGNLTSVRKAFAAAGAEIYTPDRPEALGAARAIVIPGVGHFGATAVLDRPWREAVLALVRAGRPMLGICLGLQWLFEGSEEAPELPGLSLLQGRCTLLRPGAPTREPRPDADSRAASPGALYDEPRATSDEPRATSDEPRLKVPHVGWNALEQVRPSRILRGVHAGSQAYFTHSFVAPVTDACVAVTEHGERFASVVESGRVFGAQFHPEKSGEVGLTLLRNFLTAVREAA